MSDHSDTTDERVAREALTHDSPFYPIEPKRMLLETPQCVAFLDTNPVSKGHALVVAKTVTASLFDLPAEVQAQLWETVRRAREILIKRFRPDGFNIGVNDGPAAGQTVLHAHVHIIPRYTGPGQHPQHHLCQQAGDQEQRVGSRRYSARDDTDDRVFSRPGCGFPIDAMMQIAIDITLHPR